MIMMLLNCYIESYYHTNYRRVESCTLAKLEIKAQHFSILKYDSESSYKISSSLTRPYAVPNLYDLEPHRTT